MKTRIKRLTTIRDKNGSIKFINFNDPMRKHKNYKRLDVIIFKTKNKLHGNEFWLGRKQLDKVNKRVRILEE